jgi:cytochrome b subunit of formate dehydrogenase
MATEVAGPVVRNNRRARLLHTAFYVVTLILLFTGWWLLSGHEGRPSVLARLVDEPDVELHRQAGWALAAVAVVAVTLGARGAFTFVRETLRIDRGDGRWLARFPRGALTGRFTRHRGHFDPGQRIANIAFVATLGTLIGTGIGLTTVHGGPTFVWLDHVHRLATYVLAVLVAGHVLVAIGVLPGYRGVWRAMHLGGRVPTATARRVWPETPGLDPPDAAADESDEPELYSLSAARRRRM